MKQPMNCFVKAALNTRMAMNGENYISLTDMQKAKDGDFFISDWFRNRNTIEFWGIWEQILNPDFNCGEFALIKRLEGEV